MTYDMSTRVLTMVTVHRDPTTNTVYYDEDLDGNVDHEWKLGR